MTEDKSGQTSGREQAAAKPVNLRINIAANYVGRAYAMVSNYLFIPFYVAILGPTAYGVIAFYALLLTIGGLADVGLSSTFAREAAREKDKRELIHLLTAAERILMLGAAAFSLLAFVGAPWLVEHWLNIGPLDASEAETSLRLMALMITPHLMFSLYGAGLLGLQRQVSANLLQALLVTVRSGMVVAVIMWRPDLPTFFAWQLGVTLLFMVVARLTLVRALDLPWFSVARFRFDAIRAQLGYASGMMAITLIAGVNTQLDKLVISQSLSLTEFGYYSLASVLAQVPAAITTPVMVALFPKLTAHIAADEIEEAFGDYRLYSGFIAFGGGLSGFGLFLFSPEILAIWLQQPTLPAVVSQVASLLSIGAIFLCLQLPPYYLSLAYGQNRIIAGVAGMTLVVSIPLTILAINAYGLAGAAAVWVFVTAVNYASITIAVHRRRFHGRHLGWVLDSVAVPLVIAAGPLVVARFLADRWAGNAFNSLVIAAVGALASAGIFFALHLIARRRARNSLASRPVA